MKKSSIQKPTVSEADIKANRLAARQMAKEIVEGLNKLSADKKRKTGENSTNVSEVEIEANRRAARLDAEEIVEGLTRVGQQKQLEASYDTAENPKPAVADAQTPIATDAPAEVVKEAGDVTQKVYKGTGMVCVPLMTSSWGMRAPEGTPGPKVIPYSPSRDTPS